MMGPPQKSPRHARFAKKGSQIRLSTINVGDSLTFKNVKNGSFQIGLQSLIHTVLKVQFLSKIIQPNLISVFLWVSMPKIHILTTFLVLKKNLLVTSKVF